MKFINAVGDQLLKWTLQDWLLLAAFIVSILGSMHAIDPGQLAGLAATVLGTYKLFRQFALLAQAASKEADAGPVATPTAPPLP